jgi:septum site-determining protein MinC
MRLRRVFSVEQTPAPNALQSPTGKPLPPEDPLYLQMTLRAGTEIRHSGSVIIFGDVNGGAEVFATGDILIWGKLRGLAHAGYGGNSQAVVMALSLMPTQLRIADSIAMVAPLNQSAEPEIAFFANGRVMIVPAKNFDRQSLMEANRSSLTPNP